MHFSQVLEAFAEKPNQYFKSARMDSMVLGRLPSLIAASPVSTGIETLSKQRKQHRRDESSPKFQISSDSILLIR